MNINLPFAVMPVIIFLDERLTKTDLRVLGAILSFMEPKTKQCWPKRKTIAQRCGISETKISTATTRLEVLGWLIKEGDGGRSCPSIYRFTVPARFESLNPESETVTDSETLTNKSTETVSISGRGKKETINKPIERESKDEGFNHFWDLYPRQCAKDETLKIWTDLAPDQNLQTQIIAAVIDSSSHNPQWLRDGGRYIPYPSTYLKNRRWQDGFAQKPLNNLIFNGNKSHLGTVHELKKPRSNRREHAALINDAIDVCIAEAFRTESGDATF